PLEEQRLRRVEPRDSFQSGAAYTPIWSVDGSPPYFQVPARPTWWGVRGPLPQSRRGTVEGAAVDSVATTWGGWKPQAFVKLEGVFGVRSSSRISKPPHRSPL